MSAVEESYKYCVEIARRQRNFYYSFLVLPEEKRQAFFAIYAFFRQSDDISDLTQEASKAEKQNKLNAWRSQLDRALAGDYSGNPILPAFHDTVRKFSIPREYFDELLCGIQMDLDATEYETFDDLARYCYRVAGVVGLTCIRIFGVPPEDEARARVLAVSCGLAFQLTNILRDVREDTAEGRSYLPAEDRRRFEGEQLLRFEIARAWENYKAALPLLDMVARDSRASLWAMMALYSGILRKIEERPMRVFEGRTSLSSAAKLAIVARALMIRITGVVPPPF